jgi:hypothetical protein
MGVRCVHGERQVFTPRDAASSRPAAIRSATWYEAGRILDGWWGGVGGRGGWR